MGMGRDMGAARARKAPKFNRGSLRSPWDYDAQWQQRYWYQGSWQGKAVDNGREARVFFWILLQTLELIDLYKEYKNKAKAARELKARYKF